MLWSSNNSCGAWTKWRRAERRREAGCCCSAGASPGATRYRFMANMGRFAERLYCNGIILRFGDEKQKMLKD